jgi:HAD superfamily hydrolase (TIGR01509 family)
MSLLDAVIFDMDAVLIAAAPLRLQATRAVLGERASWYTERDHRAIGRRSDVDLCRILRILFDLDRTTDDLVEAGRAHLTALVRAEGRPLPGVPAVPWGLRRAGLRLGLVSTSPRSVIRATLETLGLAEVFAAAVAGDEVAREKPAPDGLLMAARRLGASPEACLVVDGSREGILAARAAGMAVAVIPDPVASCEDVSAADLVLPSLEALPRALESNGLPSRAPR